MPGIAGLISRRSPDECRRLVDQMLGGLQHESFYTSGSYSAPDLGVFAGWTAHKGSFADCQPVVSEDGEVALLFSGECFYDSDLRARLPRQHRAETPNAGWLAPLYERRGEQFFTDLNGPFSGLLVDRRRQRTVLFNDRYGLERIYYHQANDAFFFASEAKALLRILPELRCFDDHSLAEFLEYGCTLGSNSLFRGVKVLPGASAWSFTGQRCEQHRYFTPASWESQPKLTVKSFEADLQETFTRILPRYLDPDGSIGISLTGGLDTRMIMAFAPQPLPGLVSYTFAGAKGDTRDVRLAARVAAACAVPHRVLRIDADFFSHFGSHVDRTVYLTDGCFGACGAHEIYLNRQARPLAPVRLTGNFGSEILRGMTTFKPTGLSPDLGDPGLRSPGFDGRIGAVKAAMHPVSFAAFEEIPRSLFGVIRAGQSQICVRTPYMDNAIVALAFRAPEEVRTSSSVVLRLIRQGASGLDRIPTDRGLVPASRWSSLLTSLWYLTSFKLDYWSSDGMPHWLALLESQLSGLGLGLSLGGSNKYLHYRRWFRSELRPYLEERLTDIQTRRSLPWAGAGLDRIVNDHIAGRKNYVGEIDAILTLEAIDRLLFRQPGTGFRAEAPAIA